MNNLCNIVQNFHMELEDCGMHDMIMKFSCNGCDVRLCFPWEFPRSQAKIYIDNGPPKYILTHNPFKVDEFVSKISKLLTDYISRKQSSR